MAETQDDWDFYLCERNGYDTSIVINLGLRPSAPDRTRPWQLTVKLRMKNPAQNGLSRAEERPTLDAIDDALCRQVCSSCNAVFVGRTIRQGVWQFIYFGSKPKEFKGAVDAAMANFPEYKSHAAVKDDPNWAAYDMLLPSHREVQQIMDRRVVESLKSNGDLLTASRPVTHWIYFANEFDRKTFITAAKAKGFDTEISISKALAWRAKPLCVAVTRQDFVDYQSIHKLVLQLFDLAEQSGGEYDGWEAKVVTGRVAAASRK